jgi:hypothetical protein
MSERAQINGPVIGTANPSTTEDRAHKPFEHRVSGIYLSDYLTGNRRETPYTNYQFTDRDLTTWMH